MDSIILAILGSSVITTLIMVLVKRYRERADVQKIIADTEQVESTMRQTETVYYQTRVEETIKQMRILETQIKKLQNSIDVTQDRYERRVGGLHTKIDALTNNLQIANEALAVANRTIGELQQEVKDGNIIIRELQAKISEMKTG